MTTTTEAATALTETPAASPLVFANPPCPPEPNAAVRGPRVRRRRGKNVQVRRVVFRSRRRTRRPSLRGADLDGDVQWFARQLHHKYPSLTKAEKKQVLTILQRDLPPRPKLGRPRRADVTEALRLEAEGVSRKNIYGRLGKAGHAEQHALLEAMRQRKSRQRRAEKLTAATSDSDRGGQNRF